MPPIYYRMVIARGKIGKIALSITVAAIIVLLIIDPSTYVQSAFNGMILFGTSVLPALFPFFFFSKILMYIGTAEMLSKGLRSPIRKLYGTPPSSSYILIMSLISGYPIGASLTQVYYANGYISKDDAKAISSFASTSGSLFVLGTVAIQMFHDKHIGYVILISHYIGALLNGLIYRKRKSDDIPPDYIPPQVSDNVISDAISSSVLSILFVGGYIIIFSIIIDALTKLSIIPFIATAIPLPYDISTTLLTGLVEITRGCLSASVLQYPPIVVLPLTCGMISFGGLAIALQSRAFLGDAVTMPQYLLRKLTQALISAAVCALITLAVYRI